MIKIATEKVVANGKKFYKVTGLSAMTAMDLPDAYVLSEPNVVFSQYEPLMYSNRLSENGCIESEIILKVGYLYEVEQFNDIIKYIKECKIRLNEINARIEKERMFWSGKSTFLI